MRLKSLLDVPNKDRQPLDPDQIEKFLGILTREREFPDEVFSDEFSMKLGQSGQILYQRLVAYNTKINTALAIMAVLFSKGNPGNLVLWAHAFARCAHDYKRDIVKVSDIVDRFPMGFPTDKGKQAIWEAQKDERGRNLLDTLEALNHAKEEG